MRLPERRNFHRRGSIFAPPRLPAPGGCLCEPPSPARCDRNHECRLFVRAHAIDARAAPCEHWAQRLPGIEPRRCSGRIVTREQPRRTGRSPAHHVSRAREGTLGSVRCGGALRDDLLESLRHPRRARHAAACAGSASGARRSLEAAGQLSVGFGWPPSGENYHGRVELLNRTSGQKVPFCTSRSALPQWIDLRQSRGRPA